MTQSVIRRLYICHLKNLSRNFSSFPSQCLGNAEMPPADRPQSVNTVERGSTHVLRSLVVPQTVKDFPVHYLGLGTVMRSFELGAWTR